MTAANPESILDSIKKVLGLDPDFTDFDLDVMMHINTFLVTLQGIGAGPVEGFVVSDNTQLWSDFSENQMMRSIAQSWMFLKVRMAFDPPATSFVIEANNQMSDNLEFRINVLAEQIDPPTDPFTGKPTTLPAGIIN